MSSQSILSALPPDFPRPSIDEVLARYREPCRAYHVMRHVDFMWRSHVLNGGDPRDLATLYAVFYHDVVYDPTRKDNEEMSWRLFEEHAPGLPGVTERIRGRVEAMIAASALHPISASLPEAPGDVRWFCDLDLLGLGVEFDAFQAIGRRIRKEFAHVPNDAFVAGRTAFFHSILAAPRIYVTDHFRDRFESVARGNIDRALALLAERGLD